MNIDEAIRLQARLSKSSILDPIPKYKESTKLGMEALKAIKLYHLHKTIDAYVLLPGETEE